MRVPRTRVSAPARAARGVATAREGDAGRGRSVRARSCAGRAKWCPARPPRPFRGIPTSAPKVRRFRREFGVGEFQIRYRGRTGDFEARARVRGRVLFLDPARVIRGSATPRRSAPLATPAEPGFYLQPTNCSRRARRGDTTERRRSSASPRDAAAFRARCPPRGRRPGRPRPRRRDGGGRVGATGAGRRGRRRCSFAPLARWRPRSAPRAPPAGARGSRDRDAAARDPRTRRGSPRPRRARPPPGTPPRLAAPGAPPRAIVTCRRERSAAT